MNKVLIYCRTDMDEYAEATAVIEQDQSDLLIDMIVHGLEVNAEYHGVRLLSYALQYHSIDCARILIQNGADVDMIDTYGNTPLTHLCARMENYSREIQLLESEWADVNERDHEQQTPLIAATIAENITNMEALIEAGAQVDLCTEIHPPAITFAVSYGNMKSLRCLLKHNADIENTISLESPLMLCLKFHPSPVMMDEYMPIFLECGADIDVPGEVYSPFLQCIINKNVKWAKYLLKIGCYVYNQELVLLDKQIGNAITMCSVCEYIDDVQNMCVICQKHDKLNKVLFASGEQYILTIDNVKHPGKIVREMLLESKNKNLMQWCRSVIRNTILSRGITLYSQVKDLPLPRILKKYLLYNY